MEMSRRTLIGASAAAGALSLLPSCSRAAAGSGLPDWQIGYRNAPAEGFAPAKLKTVSSANKIPNPCLHGSKQPDAVPS